MATDTFATRQISKVECEPCNDDFFEWDLTKSVINAKPGRLYKILSGGRKISSAGAGDQADGIILHRDGYQYDKTTIRDIDDAYQGADPNVRVARFCKNVGKIFWIMLVNGVGCNLTLFHKSAGGGMVTPYAYGDGAFATDTLHNVNIKPDKYFASSSDDKLRKFIVARG